MIGIGSSSPSGISGLGKTCGERPEPRPLAPREEDRPAWRLAPSGSSGSTGREPAIPRSRRPRLAGRLARCGPAPRLRGGDLLEDLDQPRDVAVERLLAARAVAACADIAGRAASSAMRSSALDQLAEGVGRGDDEALAAVGHQLARAVAGGGDHGQAAGQGLEDDERAGVVIGRQDEEVARPEARRGCRARTRGGGRRRPGPSRVDQPPERPERRRRRRRAGGSAGRRGRAGAARPGPAGAAQPLEPVVVADEQADQVVRLQARPRSGTRSGRRPGRSTREPAGVDRVGDHVDPVARGRGGTARGAP